MSMSDTLSLGALGVRSPVTVDRLLLSAGDDVVPRGTRILDWRRGTTTGGLKMPYGGQLLEWKTAAGASISDDRQPLAILEPCRHPVEWGGMCASCGDDVNTYAVRLTHDAAGPTVSHEEAHRIEQETANRLTKTRKLSLIVDLDQTVVHATVDPTVGEWMAQGEPNPNYEALRDVKRFVLADGSSPDGCWYYIKPRPGLADFLRNLSAKYEMHVYTMGTRAYATQVCAAIDPDGSLFAGRILSRDESGSLTHKNIERLFPVDQSMVVIIDDRADVWDSHQNNLVKVVPYDFFVGIGDINAGLLPKQQDTLQLPPGATAPPPAPTPPADTSPTTAENPSTPPASEPEPEQKTTTPPGSPRPTHAAIPTQDSEPNQPVTDPTPTDPPTPGTQSTDSTDSDEPKQLSIDLPVPTNADSLPTPSLSSSTPTAEAVAIMESAQAKLEARGGPRPGMNRVPSGSASAIPNGDVPEEAVKEAEEAAAVRESIIEAVREERPLARKLEAMVEAPEAPAARAVLRDDDSELDRIYAVLDEIHARFYEAYDSEWVQANGDRRNRQKERGFNRIIPAIKRRVLEGVHVLFSSVIPMNVDPSSSEYWRQSVLFGARCHTKLGPMVTHVVAAKASLTIKHSSHSSTQAHAPTFIIYYSQLTHTLQRGTEKVNQAKARGDVAIVRPEWLHRVVTTWMRAPEEDFLLDPAERDEFIRKKEALLAGAGASGAPGVNPGEPGADDAGSTTGTEMDESVRGEVEGILQGFDYQAELDALMDSDTETDDGSVSGSRSGTPAPSTPGPSGSQQLKRQRSVTPSLVTTDIIDPNDPMTRSPLAKRKRLTEMRGSSRLGTQVSGDGDSGPNGVENGEEDDDEGDESEESSSDSEIEDFLAEDLFGGDE